MTCLYVNNVREPLPRATPESRIVSLALVGSLISFRTPLFYSLLQCIDVCPLTFNRQRHHYIHLPLGLRFLPLEMFPSLPPELIRQVIEASLPSSPHARAYTERQSTLSQLCLVSRLFRDIAQPLLRQIVLIQFETGSETDFALFKGWGANVKQLLLRHQSQALQRPSLLNVSLFLPNITFLSLSDHSVFGFHLSFLKRFARKSHSDSREWIL